MHTSDSTTRQRRQHLVAFMSRNATPAADHLGLPADQTVELGVQVELSRQVARDERPRERAGRGGAGYPVGAIGEPVIDAGTDQRRSGRSERAVSGPGTREPGERGRVARRRSSGGSLRRIALVVVLAVGLAAAPSLTSGASAQTCLVWAGEIPLHQAVHENTCVQVSAGTWVLDAYVILPAGHTIQGDPTVPRDQIVLKAGPGWINTIGDGVVNDDLSGGAMAYVRHLTLDANGLATGGVGTRQITVEDSIIQGARCWGVGIAGDNVVIRNNLIRQNGADPGCTGPPGAGVYATTQNAGRPAFYAPVISDNVITQNTGPGVDIASVWLGTFTGNVVTANTSWAGFSLFGSMWTVTGNTIRHPASDQGQPYHRPCRSGPSGAHSAAIMVCQQDDTFNAISVANVISDNHISSWYGILLVGNDEAQPYWAPRGNTLERNEAFGSLHGYADDFKAGQWFSDRNHWDGEPTSF